MRERNKAILFGIVIVFGVTSLAFLEGMIIGEPVERSEVENVEMRIVGDEWSIDCRVQSTVNNSVYLFLRECGVRYGFEIGSTLWKPYDSVFVDSINGLKNGDEKWWQYYVNGVYGEVSSDRKKIVDGDYIEWKYEVPRA